MIKSELVRELAGENPELAYADVEKTVSVIFEEIAAALEAGNRVELRGFGVFSVRHRPARAGRNPRTGEPVHVDEKHVPFFRAGKDLHERINKTGQYKTDICSRK